MIEAVDIYRKMILIRRFEELLLELFSAGKLSGTTHTYVGQEPVAIAVASHLGPGDCVFSNHRCHGHYIAHTGDIEGLLAEIMGRTGGVCGGRGGSQHLHRGNFYSNGIQGGFMPIVVGMALAEKKRARGNVVVAFIGDGTLGEGAVYEALNMAALWSVPLLVVVENNRYAQSTPITLGVAGSIPDRGRCFGLSVGESDGWDVTGLTARFGTLVAQVRNEGRPHMEVVETYRLNAHSKGDDTRATMEVAAFRARDPVEHWGRGLPPGLRAAVDAEVAGRLAETLAAVEAMPLAQLAEVG
ncbi:TPP-dependent pyruvate/acetoin dehydrogenase alpha subunit [Azospirillum fermentarium]|uniref:thiamine pyrophosphate-dependent dehydrogenase E1 component subunit alpha n=1 Tax=Azospirillum fermentarium TaxID=1233114 RepID=UPI0022260C84|nr:thiamine pyrophosphate-dependent dehydrogenase E1 component subunit alpha [Azospirillum fermentarium]MCW2249516.1 TPP-dependent pyruvate/acetoin dehydrogenase alpha subunit [Azospirillum fermentarium]